MVSSGERLDVLKALGDNTRYAIYLELARSPGPLSTAQIADSLGLHGNTVRPHLERMKEVGLLDSRPEVTGTVGRPQKLYSLAGDAPSLGLEPPVFPMLARMLVDMARSSHIEAEIVLEAGRAEGRRRAQAAEGMDDPLAYLRHLSADGADIGQQLAAALADLIVMQEQLGFDPAVAVIDDHDRDVQRSSDRIDAETVDAEPGGEGSGGGESGSAVVAFAHCPFADLAVQNPEIICNLHRGLVEGFIEGQRGSHKPAMTLEVFNDVTNRDPCMMELSGPDRIR